MHQLKLHELLGNLAPGTYTVYGVEYFVSSGPDGKHVSLAIDNAGKSTRTRAGELQRELYANRMINGIVVSKTITVTGWTAC